jgi:VWFA-related protein
MAGLATSTGGNSFVPEKLDDLDAVFRQITAELRSQYLLQYYSKSEAPNGMYLPIGVQVPKRTDLKIRARQGYYVKRK